MKNQPIFSWSLILMLIIPMNAFCQDSLTVDKKKIDKIIKREIKTMGSEYQKHYKAGRLTWTFSRKVLKGKSIDVAIRLNGEEFYFCTYDPLTYKLLRAEDLR